MTLLETDPPAAGTQTAPTGLERGVAGPLEVFSQGLAAAAPSVAIAGVPGILFLMSGNGALAAALLAAVVVALVAYLIGLQARRTVSVGSLGTYAGNGLGPWGAFAASWGLMIGYLTFAGSGLLGAALYTTQFLDKLGVSADGKAWKVVLLLVLAVPAVLAPYRGLRLSARSSLTLEVLSLIAIGIIFVAVWVKTGFAVNGDQLSADGAKGSAILLAGVLAVGAYAGFESSASLGFEARDAHRTIPRIMLRTVLLLGVLYLIATYTQVQAFAGPKETLGADSAPLPVVAENAGVGWTTYVVALAVAVAMIAFVSAVLNAGARALLTLGSTGAIPSVFTRVHPEYRSPYVGIVSLSAVALVVGLVGTLASRGRLLFDSYLGTIGTWGYLTAYLLVSIATPFYLRRIRALTPIPLIASVLATVTLLYVIYKNLVPAPAYPYDIFPYIYLGLLGLGLLRFAHLRVTRPAAARVLVELQELSEEEAARRAELSLGGVR
jgi:amino acid transporter